MEIGNIIIFSVLASLLSVGIYHFTRNIILKKRKLKEEEEAKEKGELIYKEKILLAKEKFLQLKDEHDKLINSRNQKVQVEENRLKQRKQELDLKANELNIERNSINQLKSNIDRQKEIINKKENELTEIQKKYVKGLENLAGLSVEEAKKELIIAITDQAKTEAMTQLNEIIENTKLNSQKEATKIIVQTIQRISSEKTIENSVSTFHIEDESLKGKIIGREGRNIRALEAATGVELIVDDTPETIIISCFDPVRREIARLSLLKLISDGRIHPTRIEEIVNKVKSQIDDEIVSTGNQTLIDLGIHGVNIELIKMIGRMKYRSSYGQNLLMHSREVANLCGNMAAELKLNVKSAKRAGLLHDIGKVYDQELEEPHAIVGMKLAEKYNEKPDICNAIGAHHDEIEMTYLISPIIQACDAISGARPGARREVTDSYIQRLKELEDLSTSYEGVSKAYAIQAGRELRVIVDAEKLSDKDSDKLSFDISQKIQKEMTYPGQVKVVVIRETRSVNIAK